MKLASYLTISGMSDAAFARRIGVNRQTIGRYKYGDRTPKPSLLALIHHATDGAVSANDFMQEISRGAVPKRSRG
jgi:transcriptional regulator with XRE-family HTH domain